jgi:hypothetical protein
MSALKQTASASNTGRPRPAVPAQARELAARLSALFDQDSRIAGRMGDAQRRLLDANDRLWSGLAPDAFGLLYDGAAPAGHSQIAELIEATLPAGAPGPGVAVLAALQEIHWQVHRAFCAYQSACEERRQLAADIGEVIRGFLDALMAAGWSEEQARNANVHELARAGERATGHREPAR